jgi:arylsulfatase A-like enzyme
MVLEPRELAVTVRLGPVRAEQQELVVKLNGSQIDTLGLEPGLQTCQLSLPESNLVRGINTLAFEKSRDGNRPPGRTAWSFLKIEGGEPIKAVEQRPNGLFLPFGTAIEYLVRLPQDTFLTLDGIESEQQGRFTIGVRMLGESCDLLSEELVSGQQAHAVKLPVPASTWALVTMTAVGEPASGNEGLLVKHPRLRLRETLTAEEVIGVPPRLQLQTPLPRRPNVIVYLIDTLRADRLGCYGYGKPLSPAIDAFAADAVLFENTMAQSSWTRSAVASIFTGMAPPGHAVYDRKDGLTADVVTLAELLQGAGYSTASFVASGHIGPKWGMTQGFDTFKLITDNEMGLRYALSNGLNPPIIEWLERQRRKPFFLYVHTLDPHSPYDPPQDAARKFAANIREPDISVEARAKLEAMEEYRRQRLGVTTPVKLGTQTWIEGLKKGIISSTPAMLEDLNSLYDAEIHYNDTHFGELLRYLRASGLYDSSIIILVSDHGEEFLDHGFWAHGHTLFQEQLQVPLIARFPDTAVPRGSRIGGLARQIDIGVTVADYLGLTAPSDWQGRSLLPLLLGLSGYGDRQAGYAYLDLDRSFGESYIEGRWKLICDDRRGQSCRLYDLAEDPEETVDLAASQPKITAEMSRKMRLYRDESKRFEGFQADPDEETRKQLEALGYVF